MLRRPLNRETFIALRATRAATRLAAAIRVDRVTELAVLHCARCGRAIAAAADAAHPAGDSDGLVVICQLCVRAEQVATMMMPDRAEPPLERLRAKFRRG